MLLSEIRMAKKYREKNRLIVEFGKSVKNYFITKAVDYKYRWSVIKEFCQRQTVKKFIGNNTQIFVILCSVCVVAYGRLCIVKRQNKRDAYTLVEQLTQKSLLNNENQ